MNAKRESPQMRRCDICYVRRTCKTLFCASCKVSYDRLPDGRTEADVIRWAARRARVYEAARHWRPKK